MTTSTHTSGSGRTFLRACSIAVTALVCAARSAAAPPLVLLPEPLYSFDLDSPAVSQGLLGADDVLALDQPLPLPVILGLLLGLGAPGDELDGLSGGHLLAEPDAPFVLLFSVSRTTTGFAPPDPALAEQGFPYNATDQASRGQQAGDEFMSTLLFTLTGEPPDDGNNGEVRNNYDEGGSDLAAAPETSSKDVVTAPQDNVDALADLTALLGPYFSASSSSPSLSSLPGSASASGAHIFHNTLVTNTLYASHADLGLVQDDDVDAFVVFDFNGNMVFDGADRVLFSLTPGSPSLATIPGASTVGAAADVFVAEPGLAPQLFASAASLGLGAPGDDIDALDVFPCSDAAQCVATYSIRGIVGDFDDDGDVDGDDHQFFENCYGGEGEPTAPGCEPADLDGDGDVDCADWLIFLAAWTEPQPPPALEQCTAFIPAVSQWGVALVALGLLIAGTLILRRTPQMSPH